MRKFLLLASAVIPIVTFPVSASAQQFDEGDQRLEIAGIAPAACVLSAPIATNGTNAEFNPGGASSGEVRIIQLVGATDAEPLPTSINLSIPVICNASHRIQVRSQNGGLLRDGGNAASRQGGQGFGEFLPYRLSRDWAGYQRGATSETTQDLEIGAARSAAGRATLAIDLSGGGGPLVAGRYFDAIIVEFEAAN